MITCSVARPGREILPIDSLSLLNVWEPFQHVIKWYVHKDVVLHAKKQFPRKHHGPQKRPDKFKQIFQELRILPFSLSARCVYVKIKANNVCSKLRLPLNVAVNSWSVHKAVRRGFERSQSAIVFVFNSMKPLCLTFSRRRNCIMLNGKIGSHTFFCQMACINKATDVLFASLYGVLRCA